MPITVDTVINSDLATVWKKWITPSDILIWNTASDDWHTTRSEMDFKEGGRFSTRMEAKDGSMGFDFCGSFSKIIDQSLIQYMLDDNREVSIEFSVVPGGVKVSETFEAENTLPEEHQRQGWQAILNNFAQYVEGA